MSTLSRRQLLGSSAAVGAAYGLSSILPTPAVAAQDEPAIAYVADTVPGFRTVNVSATVTPPPMNRLACNAVTCGFCSAVSSYLRVVALVVV